MQGRKEITKTHSALSIGSVLVTISQHVLHVQDRLRVRSLRRAISSGGPRRSTTSRSFMGYILAAGGQIHNRPKGAALPWAEFAW